MSSLKPSLDPSLYSLQPDEIAFFQQLTGIKDEDELKQHILNVQAKAYDVCRNFFFFWIERDRIPFYPKKKGRTFERNVPEMLLDLWLPMYSSFWFHEVYLNFFLIYIYIYTKLICFILSILRVDDGPE